LKLRIYLFYTWKIFDELDSEILADVYQLDGKVGKGFNDKPFAASVRE